MPNLIHGGVRIYYQFEGDGEPLVMLHGLSDSQWGLRALGYVAPVKDRFRVILIDARGHGYSDKPHDPAAYAPALLAGDVLAVLDKLQIERTHLFGYSLGGWIGLSLAHQAPARLASLTVGGAHPYATNFSFYRTAFAQGIEAWIASLEHHHGPLPPAVRQHLYHNDSAALQALVTTDRPALWPIDRASTVPTLFFAGTHDPLMPLLKRAAAFSAAFRFCAVEGLDHYALYLRSEQVAPLLLAHTSQYPITTTDRLP
ncbi:MAG: alpha/beta fold hydrolase [Caldilinea sp. CFX5]|nr:alpha/beta fold hydrolase [Caldilinea sp. CFX5]